MSDTPHAADDCMKLLDRGYSVVLWKNALGSYSAVAVPPDDLSRRLRRVIRPLLMADHETEDFTPSQALYRLTEKAFGRIA